MISTERRRTRSKSNLRLSAIHEIDLDDVLGRRLPSEWHCGICSKPFEQLPGGWRKKGQSLEPLCLPCFGEQLFAMSMGYAPHVDE